jgi:FkbM family methyltransferase
MLTVKELLVKYGITPRGVLHIGAHNGAEFKEYKEIGFSKVIMFEPQPHWAEHIRSTFGSDPILTVEQKAVGREPGTMELFVETSNAGMSCSLLQPKVHLEQYPFIVFESKIPVEVVSLNSYFPTIEEVSPFNFINMDIQGYELEALRGATEVLPLLDALYMEVNRAELYTGCGMVWQIDEFLKPYGFVRAETDWIGGTWGDALYVRGKTV